MPDEDPIRGQVALPAPTARELATVLFRRRRVFLWAAGAVLAVAVLYAITGTKYEANMKVLVRRGRADAPVSAGENAPLDLTRMATTEEDLNSEVELLHDGEVLRKVVVQAGLVKKNWLDFLHPGDAEAQRVERAARRLGKKIKVEPVKKTNLIGVSYAAGDPEVAARVLKAVANVYLEKHMEVHRPSGESPFFAQQTAEARKELEESKRKLLRFTSAHRVVDAALERELALKKISDLDTSRRQSVIDVAETEKRVQELEAQLAQLPERSTTQLRTADNPELLKQLKSNLLDLRLKKIQLLTKFEPNHRLVEEVDRQIREAEAAIAAEGLAPVKDETTDKDPHYEWAKAELEKAQVQLKALRAREQATIEQEEGSVLTAQGLGEAAVTQDDLASSEKAAQDNYLLYVKKQEEARMDDALDARGIVNVAIAEDPVAPALPVWPAWMVVMVGAMAAGVAGSGAAFAADYLDPAFRNPEDLRLCLEAPVLASLPRMRGGGRSA